MLSVLKKNTRENCYSDLPVEQHTLHHTAIARQCHNSFPHQLKKFQTIKKFGTIFIT